MFNELDKEKSAKIIELIKEIESLGGIFDLNSEGVLIGFPTKDTESHQWVPIKNI